MSIPVNKDEKKQQILDAAIRVFARKGAVGTKIEDIAKEASIAKGTIYLYYKNKQEILKSILHSNQEMSPETIREVLESDITPEEKLNTIVNSFINSLDNKNYPLRIMPEIWAAIIRSNERKNLSNMIINLSGIISGLMQQVSKKKKRKLNNDNMALSIIALVHGLIILQSVDSEKFNANQILHGFMETVM